VEDIGLDPGIYGTHSLRRTKATLIYRRTKNLRAVQLLLGHSNVEPWLLPSKRRSKAQGIERSSGAALSTKAERRR
jgi:integrase